MNIMMIVERFYPDADANANILNRLATFFTSQGHKVTVVRIVDASEQYESQLQHGITTLRVPIDRRSLKTRSRLLLQRTRTLSDILRAAAYLSVIALTRLCSSDPILLQQALSARRLIHEASQMSADVVVTTCSPFWTHTFGYILKRWCGLGWTMYMLDPYFDNPTCDQSDSSVAKRLVDEERMLSAADSVIVTPGIFDSYGATPLRRHLDKVTPLELPILRDLTSEESVSVPISQDFINCTFVGHLYPHLRDPNFTLSVFGLVQDPRIRLNLIGGVYGGFPQGYLESLAEPLGNKLVLHPTVDPDTAVACLRQSNVLIHIGNRGTDMFPSKFLDYCSTGRPIINFYWSEDCPTLPIARKHRLCLNIGMDQKATELIAEELEEFIVRNASARMTYDEISQVLECRTSDEIASDFLAILAPNGSELSSSERLWRRVTGMLGR